MLIARCQQSAVSSAENSAVSAKTCKISSLLQAFTLLNLLQDADMNASLRSPVKCFYERGKLIL